MAVWMVRAGKYGERENVALEQGFTDDHHEGLDGIFPSATADEIVNIIRRMNQNAEVHMAA